MFPSSVDSYKGHRIMNQRVMSTGQHKGDRKMVSEVSLRSRLLLRASTNFLKMLKKIDKASSMLYRMLIR